MYGAAPLCVLIVTRRRGVFGEFRRPALVFAEKVKTLATGLSSADCGGVNVNAVAGAAQADVADFDSGWAVVGVVSGKAELGV